jgi:hypothetical protein
MKLKDFKASRERIVTRAESYCHVKSSHISDSIHSDCLLKVRSHPFFAAFAADSTANFQLANGERRLSEYSDDVKSYHPFQRLPKGSSQPCAVEGIDVRRLLLFDWARISAHALVECLLPQLQTTSKSGRSSSIVVIATSTIK